MERRKGATMNPNQRRKEGPAGECASCRERGRMGVPAERDVAGTPMCRLCVAGSPGAEVRVSVTRIPLRRHAGGHLPQGWPGGKRIVQATADLEPGSALKFQLPETVPPNRARWGIYRAARLCGVRVSVVRCGSELTVWRTQE